MPVLEPLLPLYQAQRAGGSDLSSDRIVEQRAAAHAVYRAAVVPLYGTAPTGVSATDLVVPVADATISARLYRPSNDGPLPVHLYFHGGGFWAGEAELFDIPCGRVAVDAECAVLSVNYRLAPEHPFPVPVEDCYAALVWLFENAARLGLDGDRISIGGASAGGGLAAAVTLLARDRGGPRIRLQVLEVPAVDLRAESLVRSGPTGEPLDFEGMAQAAEFYAPEAGTVDNQLASPVLAPSVEGLPEALIMTAEYDPLRAGGERYAARLAEAGVPVAHHRWDGQLHGTQHFEALIPEQAHAYHVLVVEALGRAFHGAETAR